MFSNFVIDNHFCDSFPGDPEDENYPRQVHGALFSRVTPKKTSAPGLLAYSEGMAQQLGLSSEDCDSDEFLQIFSGNRLLKGTKPYATNYGGHQFGQWAGQLGDGRVINLCELLDSCGQRVTLQLKGAGSTPYSRHADGLAVLRSSLREYLCSEAMHYLGVPTTRALSLVVTGDRVVRDMFYDGRPKLESGAIVCRVAKNFIRFGHFELLAARKDFQTLKMLVDWVITSEYSGIEAMPEGYLEWFRDVCYRTMELVIHWQRVGFVHGVLNTDNMSILGLTMDYGPYGWVEEYNPDWTPNTTDAYTKRYAFGRQPQVVYWNLVQLANAIFPLVGDVDKLQGVLGEMGGYFQQRWSTVANEKLGLKTEPDDRLHSDLQMLMKELETDVTLFYRNLANVSIESTEADFINLVRVCSYGVMADKNSEMARDWFNRYVSCLKVQQEPDWVRKNRMNKVNPKYILRNWIVYEAIEKAESGDMSVLERLQTMIKMPYAEQNENECYARKRPQWAQHLAGCSTLSCSS